MADNKIETQNPTDTEISEPLAAAIAAIELNADAEPTESPEINEEIETVESAPVVEENGVEAIEGLETEETVEETQEEPTPRSAKAFAELARKEAKLRVREQKLKDFESRMEKFEAFQRQVTSNPVEALRSFGVQPQDYYNHMVGEVPDESQVLPKRVEQLEKELLAERSRREQAEVDRKEQGYKLQIAEVLKSDTTERWELTRSMATPDDVWETMIKQYEADGTALTYEQACDKIEKYLESEAEKFVKVQKVSKRFGGTTPANTNAPKKPGTKTLSNSLSRPVAPTVKYEGNRDEYLERALADVMRRK